MEKKIISISIPEDILQQAKENCRNSGKTLSGLIRVLLKKIIAEESQND